MSDKLQQEILAKIRLNGTKPRPKWHFQVLRWMLLASIAGTGTFSGLIGAFFINDSLDLFRNGKNFAGFNPYFPWLVWGTILIACGFLGIWFVRRTPVWYRYAFAAQGAAWIALIAVLASTMRISGLWPAFHTALLDHAPWATEVLYGASSWNDVSNGRIAGTIRTIANDSVSIECLDGKIRPIAITASTDTKVELSIGMKVRGMVRAGENGILVAEKILPWFGQGRKIKKSE